MSLLLLLLPAAALCWTQGIESAPALAKAGIQRVCVAPEQAEAWQKSGFTVLPMSPADLSARVKVQPPGFLARSRRASPTQAPWVTGNGWRFVRDPGARYVYELPAGTADLAAAEAAAYGVDAVLKVDPADLEELGRMSAFLAQLPAADLPTISDLAVVDDGSPLVGEVMNLLSRRNLLFRAVRTPSSEHRMNIELGTKAYPRDSAADPSAFASRIRHELGDDQRTLRVYGSEVVICRLTGDASRLRLHVLNYGGREVEGLRLRVRGAYAEGKAQVAGVGEQALVDFAQADGATEFSLSRLGRYAVVDLTAIR